MRKKIYIFILGALLAGTLLPFFIPPVKTAPVSSDISQGESTVLEHQFYQPDDFTEKGFSPVDMEVTGGDPYAYVLGSLNGVPMIIAIDSKGNKIWNMTLDSGYAPIALTYVDNSLYCLMANYSSSTYWDVVIINIFTAVRTVVWTAKWGGSYNDYPTDIKPINSTGDEGVFVCGYTNSYGSGGYDIFLLVIDNNGNILENVYSGTANSEYGYAMSIYEALNLDYIYVIGGTDVSGVKNVTITKFQWIRGGSTSVVSTETFNIKGLGMAVELWGNFYVVTSEGTVARINYADMSVAWETQVGWTGLSTAKLKNPITISYIADYDRIMVILGEQDRFCILDANTGGIINLFEGFDENTYAPTIVAFWYKDPYSGMKCCRLMAYDVNSVGPIQFVDMWYALLYNSTISFGTDTYREYYKITAREGKTGTLKIQIIDPVKSFSVALFDQYGKLIYKKSVGGKYEIFLTSISIELPYTPTNNTFYLMFGDISLNSDVRTVNLLIWDVAASGVEYQTEPSFMTKGSIGNIDDQMLHVVEITGTAKQYTVVLEMDYKDTPNVELYYANGTLVEDFGDSMKLIILTLDGSLSTKYYLVFRDQDGDLFNKLTNAEIYYRDADTVGAASSIPDFLTESGESGGLEIPGYSILWLGIAALLGAVFILNTRKKMETVH